MGAAPEMLRTPRQFAALQQSSKSKVHPLLVARFAPNDLDRTRFAFSTGRRLGTAVVRNRVRRRLREAVRAVQPRIRPGWDVLIVARAASSGASYAALLAALERVLVGARVMNPPSHDSDRGARAGAASGVEVPGRADAPA